MDVMQILFLALLFLAVFGLVYFALSRFLANPVRDRLEVIAGGAALRPERPPSQWVQRIVKLTGPLAKLSVPEEGWESSSVRTHFMNEMRSHRRAFPALLGDRQLRQRPG